MSEFILSWPEFLYLGKQEFRFVRSLYSVFSRQVRLPCVGTFKHVPAHLKNKFLLGAFSSYKIHIYVSIQNSISSEYNNCVMSDVRPSLTFYDGFSSGP